MKKIFLILFVLISVAGMSQTYNPATGTVSNKPYSPGQGFSTDSRSQFYDANFGLWRDYVSISEVLSYLNLPKYRMGGIDIYINTGGGLSAGVITGGIRNVYWFKDGVADANLVLKNAISTVNGQTGNVVTKNADSLKGHPVDTGAVAHNGYYLIYDSVNKKFSLIQPTAGYTPGTGITIIGNVISATNTVAIWNANQLRGRSITTDAPSVGNVPVWDGTQWAYGAGGGGSGGVISGYFIGDTLTLVTTGGNISIGNVARKDYVDSLVAASQQTPIQFDVSFLGTSGPPGTQISLDTVNYYYTITNAHVRDSVVTYRIDSIVNNFPMGGVSGGKTKIYSNSSGSDSIIAKINDSNYVAKKPVAGANTTVFTTDSTFGFNASPGTAEVNTEAFTLAASGTHAIPSSGRVVDFIEIFPTSDLLTFTMGTASLATQWVYPTPAAGGVWTLIECNAYFPSTGTLYFAGITSSTQIKVHYQIQHE